MTNKILYFIRVQILVRYEEEFSIVLSFLLWTSTLPTGYTSWDYSGWSFLWRAGRYSHTVFLVFFYLLHTRIPKYHLILTSCTKRLQHRKCFVFCSIWPIFLGWHQLILLVHWPVSVFMFGKATGKLFLDIFKGNNERAGLILQYPVSCIISQISPISKFEVCLEVYKDSRSHWLPFWLLGYYLFF